MIWRRWRCRTGISSIQSAYPYYAARRIDIYGIVIDQIASTGPGPAVAAAVPRLVRIVEQSLWHRPTTTAGPNRV